MTRSLSNLYKQWFVHTENQNTRVINSDALIGEYFGKGAQRGPKIIGMEDPAEGAAEQEDIAAQTEQSEKTVTAAYEEAEKILAEAREHADRLIAEAQSKAEQIREEAKQQGIEEGQTWLEQEAVDRKKQLEEEYRGREEQQKASYQEKQKHMESDLVDVILEVFNKVFHIQFDNKKEILLHLIDNAILNIEGEKQFRIKVAESNVQFLENHKDDILDRVGHDIELEFVSDTTMDGNNCVIETDSGVFDCSLGVQLENLIKDIRSLSLQG